MTDQELADWVIALGVGRKYPSATEQWLYCIAEAHVKGCTKKDFVHDWRVAGALLEKMADCEIDEYIQTSDFRDPRAIIEACVAALSDETN